MNALHPRVQVRWGLVNLLAVIALGALVTAADRFLLGISQWLGPSLVAVLVPLVVVYAALRYRSWGYELQADALELTRGVFTKVDTAVPYVRVQHVDTRRRPLDRALGLASVVVYTAGSRGADVTVPGLRPDEARDLRNRLRDLTIESEPGDAV